MLPSSVTELLLSGFFPVQRSWSFYLESQGLFCVVATSWISVVRCMKSIFNASLYLITLIGGFLFVLIFFFLS